MKRLRRSATAAAALALASGGLLLGSATAPASAATGTYQCVVKQLSQGFGSEQACTIDREYPGGHLQAYVAWTYASYYSDGSLKDPGSGTITYKITDDGSDNACFFARVHSSLPDVDSVLAAQTTIEVCNGASKQLEVLANQGKYVPIAAEGTIALQTKLRASGDWVNRWKMNVRTAAP